MDATTSSMFCAAWLAIRMRQHCDNARRLAEWLAGQPQVERVFYPGLPSHPGHELAKRQMRDSGGMISVRLSVGIEDADDLQEDLRRALA